MLITILWKFTYFLLFLFLSLIPECKMLVFDASIHQIMSCWSLLSNCYCCRWKENIAADLNKVWLRNIVLLILKLCLNFRRGTSKYSLLYHSFQYWRTQQFDQRTLWPHQWWVDGKRIHLEETNCAHFSFSRKSSVIVSIYVTSREAWREKDNPTAALLPLLHLSVLILWPWHLGAMVWRGGFYDDLRGQECPLSNWGFSPPTFHKYSCSRPTGGADVCMLVSYRHFLTLFWNSNVLKWSHIALVIKCNDNETQCHLKRHLKNNVYVTLTTDTTHWVRWSQSYPLLYFRFIVATCGYGPDIAIALRVNLFKYTKRLISESIGMSALWL